MEIGEGFRIHLAGERAFFRKTLYSCCLCFFGQPTALFRFRTSSRHQSVAALASERARRSPPRQPLDPVQHAPEALADLLDAVGLGKKILLPKPAELCL